MVRYRLALLIGITAVACGGGNTTPDGLPPNPACVPAAGSTVITRQLATFNDLPVLVTSPPSDARLFVVLRAGSIEILDNGQVRPTPFMDLDDNAGGPVLGGGEQGLLGLAFHPQYATNRKFYVYYTTTHVADGLDYDEIAEYQTMAADPDHADMATARVVLSIEDFAANHNGGMIEFGPDGLLYIGTGDGGGGGDPRGSGQDLDTLLGKMLRIDVDTPGGGREYGIPAGNPYAAGGGAPEVFMNGLRNPWRWSFDPNTNDIYIGDVGQGAVEEIDVVPLATAAGTDFGWNECEGTHGYGGTLGCDAPTQPNRKVPVYEQDRTAGSNWESVIGGQVYRGSCFPALAGRYFYSDYNAGGIWSFVYAAGQATDAQQHAVTVPRGPTSIHGDAYGELYVTFEADSSVHRIEAQ